MTATLPTPSTFTFLDFLNSNFPVAHKAYELAKVIHKDDKRDNPNKSPYIQHIEAVIVGTYKNFQAHPYLADGLHSEKNLDYCLAAAALHDATEDHPDTAPREYLYDQLSTVTGDTDPYFLLRALDVIDHVTKRGRKVEGYDEYLNRVMEDMWSIAIKLADLDHNMLDATAGSRLDKYQISHKVLKDAFFFELPEVFTE